LCLEELHVEPTPADLIRVASILWGPPHKGSKAGELRFGRHDSKSLDVDNGVWFDHEEGVGGGTRELYEKAGQSLPQSSGEPSLRRPRQIVATYDYNDESGTLLFQTVRFASGSPRFLQRQPDGRGGWDWNIAGVRRVLYRLPELLAADDDEPVVVPEGEKDVDRLRANGLAATCNPMGAGKWLPEHTEALRGRDILLLPDNDNAGREHSARIAAALAGVARSIVTINLPGLPEKGDVSDWFNQGHTADDLIELYRVTPLNVPGQEPLAEPPPRNMRAQLLPDVPLNLIPPRPWVYGNFLLRGHTAVLGARDGGGKGQIAIGIALGLITGRFDILHEKVRQTGPVAIISYEDDRDEWQRRIGAACLVHGLDYGLARQSFYFLDLPDRRIVLAELLNGKTLFPDGDEIIAALRDIGAVAFIIDPFNHAHQVQDGNSNVLIAQVAGETERIAAMSRTAGLVLHHVRKGSEGKVDDLMGATALRATFRSCRILQGMDAKTAESFDLDEPWRYIRIADSKENYSIPADQAFWYRLASIGLPNGTDEYPDGDNVGVATHWTPPSPFAGLDWGLVLSVLGQIDRGMEDGYRYSSSRQATKRWAGNLLIEADKPAELAGRIIAGWLDSGLLRNEEYHNPDSKDQPGLVVDATKLAAMRNAAAAPGIDVSDL
jgi:hypothetical protein